MGHILLLIMWNLKGFLYSYHGECTGSLLYFHRCDFSMSIVMFCKLSWNTPWRLFMVIPPPPPPPPPPEASYGCACHPYKDNYRHGLWSWAVMDPIFSVFKTSGGTSKQLMTMFSAIVLLCAASLLYLFVLIPCLSPHIIFHPVNIKLHCGCPSLPFMLFLFEWPPSQRSDTTLVECP